MTHRREHACLDHHGEKDRTRQTSVGIPAQIQRQGRWLFHRRSLAGLVLIPVWIMAVWEPGIPGSLLTPHGMRILTMTGFAISVLGSLLRWITVARVPSDTSRRSNRILQAGSLNTLGMYSVVRHPLYLANALAASGFVLATGSLWFFLVFQLTHALYIERVMACEDAFLEQTHGEAWRRWAAHTPAFCPRLASWKSDSMAFSLRTVLRREYNGVFVIAMAFALLVAVRGMLIHHQTPHAWLLQNKFWCLTALAGISSSILFRTLKRRTRFLHIPGR